MSSDESPCQGEGRQFKSGLGRWRYRLMAQGLAPKTVTAYVWSVRCLEDFTGKPAGEATEDDCAAFLTDVLARQSTWTAATHYRGLQQYFTWAEVEGEMPISPLRNLRKPRVQETPIPVVSPDDFTAVLGTCSDLSFSDVRDGAILRLFWTTGARLSEVADLHRTDLVLTNGLPSVKVMGKGRKPRLLPLTEDTHAHLDAYLGVRGLHHEAGTEWLWVSGQGHFTGWGIRRMMAARCRKAGVPVFHPHQLRHTFAHRWLAAGGSEGGLMALCGWSSRQMLLRYGAALRQERAFEEYRRLGP